jgi:hypothetical protein
VAVHDFVDCSAVGESDVCPNALEQKQYATITTSTQPKATTLEARQSSADGGLTEADRRGFEANILSVSHPPHLGAGISFCVVDKYPVHM